MQFWGNLSAADEPTHTKIINGDGTRRSGVQGQSPMGPRGEDPISWRHILKITIASIISRYNYISID